MDIWRAGTECGHPSYESFKEALNQASYHYADDSGLEWSKARVELDAAVEIAIQNQYPFWAIKRMFGEIKPLVDLDSFMGRLLTKLYGA